ncbi:MAG: SpoIIE family protein phosphatase [Spirochaetes bacterium]|nr:SpoIIE family protein phosphatase [Spirochaetota bacterium]
MSILSGYTLTEKIAEGGKSVVYRGIRESDNLPVILKIIREANPSLSDIARFKKEYELIKAVRIDGVIKTYGLIEEKDRIAMVLEDFNGVSIKEIINKRRFDIEEFLEVAVLVAETLGYIHENKIIHRDIKPHNLLYNTSTGEVKITDFGISSLLGREHENIYDPWIISGTLPYMSPEQTGRINRPIDHRTDLYSLGVSFYEMLTGSVPFTSKDPLDILYCHIAREPVPPDRLNGDIPDIISDIILKLLAKNGEDRYNSSYGLKSDLEECARQLKKYRKINRFDLGHDDYSNRFILPRALIGREREKSLMMDAFNRVCQGAVEMVVVTGPQGVGKSSLVSELEKMTAGQNGYFISSKYEMTRQSVPYSALIHSFQKLMLRILAEGEERVSRWRNCIMRALGSNCRVMIDVIPELEMIIDRQPDLPEIDPEKSQYRFKLVLGEFIRVFTKREHPLVIFLDDLQWADAASLQLISRLMNDYTTGYLLLIAAFRDSEVGPDHPLTGVLAGFSDRISRITLDPLTAGNISEYLYYIINSRKSDVFPLAEVLYNKTNGNPFFLVNLLRAIYDSRYLRFVSSEGWEWDIERIIGMQVSENVVELMTERFAAMDAETQNVLKIAACIGNRFDLEDMAILLGKNIDDALSDLQKAIDEGLVYLSNKYYYFLHDKIQEVIYSLLPAAEESMMHYRIGRLLIGRVRDEELHEKIFYIVNQMNAGSSQASTRDERIEIARLNLMAGHKAKSATAYAEALNYFRSGIALLESDSWESDYRLTYDLHIEKAECEYLDGDYDGAFGHLDYILDRARGSIDRARVYDKKVIMYTSLGSHRLAMEYGIEALKLFGMRIPPRPGRRHIILEMAKARIKLGKRRVDDLANSPDIVDPEITMIQTLCMNTGTAAYFVDNDVVAFLAMKLVNLTLEHGNSKIASFAYLSYALILGSGMGRYGSAYRYGMLALELNDKYKNADLEPRLLFIFGFLVSHWRKHYSRTLDLLNRSYRVGVETGDLNFAVYSAINSIQYRIRYGGDLDEIYNDLAGYRDFVYRVKNEEFIFEFIMAQRYILSQKSRTRSISDYSDDEFNEKEFVEKIRQYRVTLHSYYIYKMISLYHAREYDDALGIAAIVKDTMRDVLFGQTNVVFYYFFHSLSLVASIPGLPEGARRSRLIQVMKNQRRLGKWAHNCPENYRSMYLLVRAEVAAARGRYSRAADLYGEAIKEARANNSLLCESIGNERAAMFHLFRGNEFIARAYLVEAHYCYTKYGSAAVAHRIGREYPQFISGEYLAASRESHKDHSSSSSGIQGIDFTMLLKTTQIISGEIVLEKLLKKLTIVIGECAAATKGALIMEKDGALVIEASGDIATGRIEVLKSIPIYASGEISSAIVHYVARTMENLVLNDAANMGLFVNDPYIRKNRCKSVLCLPIMSQAKLTAIFYAENSLTTQAFTEERIELLKTLASYVAISVDNASLYAKLEDKVKERTMALEYAYEQVNRAYQTIQEDISLARRIQENILQSRLGQDSRFSLDIRFYPMSEVGGDIYDIVEIKPGILRVLLADATGHGIQAALVTMLIKSEYEKLKYQHIAPSELMGILNKEFFIRYGNMSVLFSCIIVDIDINTRSVRYASAGHPDQYIIQKGDVTVLKRTGKIVGFGRDLAYGCDEIPISLDDKLVLFSDGIYEEFDLDMKEYGELRLREVIRKCSREPVQIIARSIIQDVRDFTGSDRINANDDVTIIGVEMR